MLITIVTIIIWIVSIYLICGAVFTILFFLRGLSIVDEGANGSTIGFRIIIIPGCLSLWPLLLRKWIQARRLSLNNKS